MRAYLSIALTAVALSVFSIAFAAEKTVGSLISIDLNSGTLIMSDDLTYTLPDGFEDPAVVPGNKVEIIWEAQDDKSVVKSVTAIED